MRTLVAGCFDIRAEDENQNGNYELPAGNAKLAADRSDSDNGDAPSNHSENLIGWQSERRRTGQ